MTLRYVRVNRPLRLLIADSIAESNVINQSRLNETDDIQPADPPEPRIIFMDTTYTG